jgi:hypothetical protein
MRNRIKYCCLTIAEGALAGYLASAAVWFGLHVSVGL